MELSAGDEVIVPSHGIPTVEPIIIRGAKPVFVDVDDSYRMDPAQSLPPSVRAPWA